MIKINAITAFILIGSFKKIADITKDKNGIKYAIFAIIAVFLAFCNASTQSKYAIALITIPSFVLPCGLVCVPNFF